MPHRHPITAGIGGLLLLLVGHGSAAGGDPAPECRATNGTHAIVLTLKWVDGGTAKGQLTVDGKAQPVIAEMYKGLILVDAPGAPQPHSGKVATVWTDMSPDAGPDGQKMIRLGDDKQPSFACH
jgi:hypothetical protein